jgi:hypothetical protein
MSEVVDPAQQAMTAPQAPPARALTVIEAAIRSGATPDQLERLLDLQVRADNHQLELMREKRRMGEEDRILAAKLAFDDALNKLRSHNVIIPKTKEVVQTARSGGAGPRFMQSEFDVVCKMLSPALFDCGLSFRHDQQFGAKKWTTDGVESDIAWVYVTCFLTHKDGHSEKLTLEGPPDTSGSKNPLQEMQSTASYLKRQSLLAITGTATGGEDDEGTMRGRGAIRHQHQDQQHGGRDESEELLTAGSAAANGGMTSLTAWWGALTSKQRTALSPEFPGMRKKAQQADQQGAHGG